MNISVFVYFILKMIIESAFHQKCICYKDDIDILKNI